VSDDRSAPKEFRHPAGSARIGMLPSRWSRSITKAALGASITPCRIWPPGSRRWKRKDGMDQFSARMLRTHFFDGVIPDRTESIPASNIVRMPAATPARSIATWSAPEKIRRSISSFGSSSSPDREPAAIAGMAAMRAADRMVEHNRAPVGALVEREATHDFRQRGFRPGAMLAQAPDQPLGQHALEDGGNQVNLQAHILEPRDRRRGRIGVQGREHQVPRQRRLHRRSARFRDRGFRRS